jgi:hypothetical protein
VANTVDVEPYYDPFDFEIDDNPYPVWRQLREHAPLYRNEKYGFYALSRHSDVARDLIDWDTYRSGRGTVIEIILNRVEVPPGVILFEDPPIHDHVDHAVAGGQSGQGDMVFRVGGRPSMSLELYVEQSAGDRVNPGMTATAIAAVNAIPGVVDAPPGVVAKPLAGASIVSRLSRSARQ